MPLSLPLLTNRLLLRNFIADDFAAIHAYSADPEVVRHMFWGRAPSRSRAPPSSESSSECSPVSSQRERSRMAYERAVVRRADNVLIGAADLTLERHGDTLDGDLGYVLARGVGGTATQLRPPARSLPSVSRS